MPQDSLIRVRQLHKPEVSGYVEEIIAHHLQTGTISGIATNTGQLTGAFYPLNQNPSGYIDSGDISDLASHQDVIDSANNVLAIASSLYYPLSNPSGFGVGGGTATGIPAGVMTLSGNQTVTTGEKIFRDTVWFGPLAYGASSPTRISGANGYICVGAHTELRHNAAIFAAYTSPVTIDWNGKVWLTDMEFYAGNGPAKFKFFDPTTTSLLRFDNQQYYQEGKKSLHSVIDYYGNSPASGWNPANDGWPFIYGFHVHAFDLTSNGYDVLTTETPIVTDAELLATSGALVAADAVVTNAFRQADLTLSGVLNTKIETIAGLDVDDLLYLTGTQSIVGKKTFENGLKVLNTFTGNRVIINDDTNPTSPYDEPPVYGLRVTKNNAGFIQGESFPGLKILAEFSAMEDTSRARVNISNLEGFRVWDYNYLSFIVNGSAMTESPIIPLDQAGVAWIGYGGLEEFVQKLAIGTIQPAPLSLFTNGVERVFIDENGHVGINRLVPTANLHVNSGATGAGSAPIKFTSGKLMTNPESGALEYDGSALYFTNNLGRRVSIADDTGSVKLTGNQTISGTKTFNAINTNTLWAIQNLSANHINTTDEYFLARNQLFSDGRCSFASENFKIAADGTTVINPDLSTISLHPTNPSTFNAGINVSNTLTLDGLPVLTSASLSGVSSVTIAGVPKSGALTFVGDSGIIVSSTGQIISFNADRMVNTHSDQLIDGSKRFVQNVIMDSELGVQAIYVGGSTEILSDGTMSIGGGKLTVDTNGKVTVDSSEGLVVQNIGLPVGIKPSVGTNDMVLYSTANPSWDVIVNSGIDTIDGFRNRNRTFSVDGSGNLYCETLNNVRTITINSGELSITPVPGSIEYNGTGFFISVQTGTGVGGTLLGTRYQIPLSGGTSSPVDTGSFLTTGTADLRYVQTGQTGQFASSGNLAATGSGLQISINSLNTWTGNSTGLYSPYSHFHTGYITTGVADTRYVQISVTGQFASSGNLNATGSGLQVSINSLNSWTGISTGLYSSYSHTHPSYLTPGAASGLFLPISGSGAYALKSDTGAFLTTGAASGLFAPIAHTHNNITGLILNVTGRRVSGEVVLTGTNVNISSIGQTITFSGTLVDDGTFVRTTGNQIITGLKTFGNIYSTDLWVIRNLLAGSVSTSDAEFLSRNQLFSDGSCIFASNNFTIEANGTTLINPSVTGISLHPTNPSTFNAGINVSSVLTFNGEAVLTTGTADLRYVQTSETGQFASSSNLAATGSGLQVSVNSLNSWTGTSTGLYSPLSHTHSITGLILNVTGRPVSGEVVLTGINVNITSVGQTITFSGTQGTGTFVDNGTFVRTTGDQTIEGIKKFKRIGFTGYDQTWISGTSSGIRFASNYASENRTVMHISDDRIYLSKPYLLMNVFDEGSNIGTSKGLGYDTEGRIHPIDSTVTELNYSAGVTGGIQTQFNNLYGSTMDISGVKNFTQGLKVSGNLVATGGPYAESSHTHPAYLTTGAASGLFMPISGSGTYVVTTATYQTIAGTKNFTGILQWSGQPLLTGSTSSFVLATNTGSFLTTGAADSRYIQTGQSGQFASANNLSLTGSGLQVSINSLNAWTGISTGLYSPYSHSHSYITTGDADTRYVQTGVTGQFASSSNLNATGSGLQASVNSLNAWTGGSTGLYSSYSHLHTGYITTGNADLRYATINNLLLTGSGLQISVNNLNTWTGNSTGLYSSYSHLHTGYITTGAGDTRYSTGSPIVSYSNLVAAGTILTVNFSGLGNQQFNLSAGGTYTITGSGYPPTGKLSDVLVYIENTYGSPTTLTFPSSWKNIGTGWPSSLAANKSALLWARAIDNTGKVIGTFNSQV